MKIALIDASPKAKGSTSGILLEDLRHCLSGREGMETVNAALHSPQMQEETWKKLECADVWIFACPLYVDCLPGHLLSCLGQMEEKYRGGKEIPVYGIVNCGFYEGIQAETALKVMQNWCAKVGFTWCGGIGVGGGGALPLMAAAPPEHGPKAPINKALLAMAECIAQGSKNGGWENRYVSVAFPRVLYKMAAQTGWRHEIKANGGKAKDLGKRP